MAKISVDRVWITNPNNNTERVVCGSNDRNETDSQDVRVGTYANDRRRMISSPKTAHVISTRLTWLTAADVAWLRRHKGVVVLYRDRKGVGIYCVYPAIKVSTYKDNIHFDVEITLQSITYSGSV